MQSSLRSGLGPRHRQVLSCAIGTHSFAPQVFDRENAVEYAAIVAVERRVVNRTTELAFQVKETEW